MPPAYKPMKSYPKVLNRLHANVISYIPPSVLAALNLGWHKHPVGEP